MVEDFLELAERRIPAVAVLRIAVLVNHLGLEREGIVGRPQHGNASAPILGAVLGAERGVLHPAFFVAVIADRAHRELDRRSAAR